MVLKIFGEESLAFESTSLQGRQEFQGKVRKKHVGNAALEFLAAPRRNGRIATEVVETTSRPGRRGRLALGTPSPHHDWLVLGCWQGKRENERLAASFPFKLVPRAKITKPGAVPPTASPVRQRTTSKAFCLTQPALPVTPRPTTKDPVQSCQKRPSPSQNGTATDALISATRRFDFASFDAELNGPLKRIDRKVSGQL